MNDNPLLIHDLTARATEAKTQLALKLRGLTVAPASELVSDPWCILTGDDPTLQADTIAVYDALISQLGQAGLGRVITMEYPWLLKPEIPLLRVWWILTNILDALPATGDAGREAAR